MFTKQDSAKGGKKSYRTLRKKLGSDEAVSKHFKQLALKKKKNRKSVPSK